MRSQKPYFEPRYRMIKAPGNFYEFCLRQNKAIINHSFLHLYVDLLKVMLIYYKSVGSLRIHNISKNFSIFLLFTFIIQAKKCEIAKIGELFLRFFFNVSNF